MEVSRVIESWVLGFYNSKLVPLKLEYYLLCIDKRSIFESGTFSRVPYPSLLPASDGVTASVFRILPTLLAVRLVRSLLVAQKHFVLEWLYMDCVTQTI